MQPLAMEVDRPGNERWGVEELYHLPIDTIERDLSSHVRAFQQRSRSRFGWVSCSSSYHLSASEVLILASV